MPPDPLRATNGESPLRILMVLESDFTLRGGGGAESQLRTIALQLKRLGHRVAVITPLLPWGPQVTAQRCYGLAVGRFVHLVVGGLERQTHHVPDMRFVIDDQDMTVICFHSIALPVIRTTSRLQLLKR